MQLKSRSPAFGAAGKGEARTPPLKGAEAVTTESTYLNPWRGRKTNRSRSNRVNRRIRTGMYGGVGGESREDALHPNLGGMAFRTPKPD